jgi:hypothetical protein
MADAGSTASKIEWRLELVQVPVSDVDRAKAFYADQVGFIAEHDHQVSEELRFVQLTPPGSACSISLTTGAHQMQPGSLSGLQLVVERRRGKGGAGGARGRGERGAGVPLGPLRVLRRPGRQRLGRPGDRSLGMSISAIPVRRSG